MRLRRTYGVAAPQLARLMMTLGDEADSRNPGGLALVEAVTTALGHLLVRHAGVERARPVRARGGLSTVARRRALEMIEARLDARLTVDALAREVGLSPAQFARAFKETIGRAPSCVNGSAENDARSISLEGWNTLHDHGVVSVHSFTSQRHAFIEHQAGGRYGDHFRITALRQEPALSRAVA